MGVVRVDKWLWSVRLFKTRTIATDACKTGKVKENGSRVKPSRDLKGGEILEIRKGDEIMTVKVTGLIDKRVGHPEAILHYDNLTPERIISKKSKSYFITDEHRDRGLGRPTKKERRAIGKLKGR